MSLMSHVPDSISFLADYPLQAHNTFGFDVRARLLCRIEHKEHELTLYADDDFKLGQVKDVMVSKMAKRNVDVRFLDYGKIEKIGGDKVKQVVTVKKGVSGDLAKKIVRLVKDSKIKVQASIQGDAVRVNGTKRDDLQSVIALLRKDVTDTPLDFNNFRD
jgi:uncharacterized protein YajQ (UPF0234 family)